MKDVELFEDRKEMISVIVPIYNVESYLRLCLESLKAQTFSDVEFILVDDGSTDRSGEIANGYSDSRFKVFHTENRGLSAARNFGIDHSSGSWIMFVDSDDYVTPDFCEKAYNTAIKNRADMVVFQKSYLKNGIKFSSGRASYSSPEGIVDIETALLYAGNAAWNKLYKRELFKDIRYPEGRVFEDLAVTHKIIMSAERIVMIPDVLYYHNTRTGSISTAMSSLYKRDGFIAAYQKYHELKEANYNNEEHRIMLYSFSIVFLATANPSDDPVFHQAEEVVNAIPGIPRNLPWKHKLLLLVWKISPRLFHALFRILGQKDNS